MQHFERLHRDVLGYSSIHLIRELVESHTEDKNECHKHNHPKCLKDVNPVIEFNHIISIRGFH